MLDTGRLSVAGVDSSKSLLLQGIWQAVQAYNAIPSDNVQTTLPKVALALDAVAFGVGRYLTSKPPQGTVTNTKRWNALRGLAEGLGKEADRRGIRLLKGPTDYKKIAGGHATQSYWLERIDPQHRVGFELSQRWQGWLSDPAAKTSKQSFWAFIGTVDVPSEAQQFVKYYPNLTGNLAAEHTVHFENDDLMDSHGQPLSTALMSTAFSGLGWAIFVCGPDWKMYANSHEVGKHHHSSFLAGGAVAAAGELVVNNGMVMCVTAKSGHYTPTPENIRNFLRKFQQIPGGALVRPSLLDLKDHNEARFYWAWQYRESGLSAPVLRRGSVLATLPHFARQSTEALAMLARVPA